MLVKTLIISTAILIVLILMVDAKPIEKNRIKHKKNLVYNQHASDENPRILKHLLDELWGRLDIVEELNNEELKKELIKELKKGIKNSNEFLESENMSK